MIIRLFCACMETNKLEKIINTVNKLINSLNCEVVELITLSALLENALKNIMEDVSGRDEQKKDIKALLVRADNLIKNHSINNFNK